MTALLLFSLLWLFSFMSAFLISLIKLTFWLKLSTDKRQAEDMVGEGGLGRQGPALFQAQTYIQEKIKTSEWTRQGQILPVYQEHCLS